MAAAAAGPIIAEDGPGAGSRRGGFEVDLDDFAGGVASRITTWKNTDSSTGAGVVVDERHVDSGGITCVSVLLHGSGMLAVWRSRPQRVVDDETVLDLAHSEQIGALAAVHGCDQRGKLFDLAVPQLSRAVSDVVLIARKTLSVPTEPNGVLFVEEVFWVPPCDVIGPQVEGR